MILRKGTAEMKEIIYVKGDATKPQAEGYKIITHICNDIGGWGKGFVLALSKRWQAPEKQYREWYRAQDDFALGRVQFVAVENEISVANMIAQHGIKRSALGVPIRYEALDACLQIVAEKALSQSASVHMPRIGCGLAGGKWEQVEEIIQRRLCQNDIAVYVYDFEISG